MYLYFDASLFYPILTPLLTFTFQMGLFHPFHALVTLLALQDFLLDLIFVVFSYCYLFCYFGLTPYILLCSFYFIHSSVKTVIVKEGLPMSDVQESRDSPSYVTRTIRRSSLDRRDRLQSSVEFSLVSCIRKTCHEAPEMISLDTPPASLLENPAIFIVISACACRCPEGLRGLKFAE